MSWENILKIKIKNLKDIKRLGKDYAIEDMYESMIISEEKYESLNNKEKAKYHGRLENLIRTYDDKGTLSQEAAFHRKMRARILNNFKLPTYNEFDNVRYTDELRIKGEEREEKRKEREEKQKEREERRKERENQKKQGRPRKEISPPPEPTINQMIVDYFKIYNNMYGRNPTLPEIEEEEERPLTVDEIKSFKLYTERFIKKSWENTIRKKYDSDTLYMSFDNLEEGVIL